MKTPMDKIAAGYNKIVIEDLRSSVAILMAMVADYYKGLVDSGIAPDVAIALTIGFQNKLLGTKQVEK